MSPVVSVVMAARNAERLIGDAIASILAQTFTDFELLVVDDASTDRTADVVRNVGDPRVRLLSPGRHCGLPGALNYGMEHAAGELIARHDHDDVSDPERFERQVSYLRGHGEVALVGTRAWLIDEAGRRVGILDRCLDDVSVRWYHLFDNAFVHSTVMFRRDVVWGELGGYDASLPSSEDYELWGRVLERHAAANLPDRLLSYRITTGSKMAGDEEKWEQGPYPETQRRLVAQHIRRTFGDLLSPEELRLTGNFALGVKPEEAPPFFTAFWRLCDAYERSHPEVRRSSEFARTIGSQVDAVAARLRPFSRGAAAGIYARALVARPSLATTLPWARALGRIAVGAAGPVMRARLGKAA